MPSNLTHHVSMEYLWLNQVATTILFTAVVYDHFLVFRREIDYIWCRSWTWVSTLYIIIRYLGLCWTFAYGYINSTFSHDSVIAYVSKFQYQTVLLTNEQVAMELVIIWTYGILTLSADLVMILRTYAMWNRSRPILRFLLCIYVPQVIVVIFFTCYYGSRSRYISASTIRLFNTQLCEFSYKFPYPAWSSVIPQSASNLILLVLAVFQAVKQSIDMYKAVKKWQPNQYMMLLVREEILYFFMRLLYDIVYVVCVTTTGFTTLMLFLKVFVCIPFFTMLPRFIVGIRETYDRDLIRRWGIDSAFGVLSQPVVPEIATLSAIAFPDGVSGQTQTLEESADDLEDSQPNVVRVVHV